MQTSRAPEALIQQLQAYFPFKGEFSLGIQWNKIRHNTLSFRNVCQSATTTASWMSSRCFQNIVPVSLRVADCSHFCTLFVASPAHTCAQLTPRCIVCRRIRVFQHAQTTHSAQGSHTVFSGGSVCFSVLSVYPPSSVTSAFLGPGFCLFTVGLEASSSCHGLPTFIAFLSLCLERCFFFHRRTPTAPRNEPASRARVSRSTQGCVDVGS